jgi:hypothetical protein
MVRALAEGRAIVQMDRVLAPPHVGRWERHDLVSIAKHATHLHQKHHNVQTLQFCDVLDELAKFSFIYAQGTEGQRRAPGEGPGIEYWST